MSTLLCKHTDTGLGYVGGMYHVGGILAFSFPKKAEGFFLLM
jgi:hypothetical protein